MYAALKNNIDLEKTLSYPLTPVPFSLCHTNGIICKTPKSIVLQELLTNQNSNTDIPVPDITIYDGFYLLHTLLRIPEKYAAISKYIFHIIFDKYHIPTIKDHEHQLRGEESEIQYDIRRENKRSADFGKLLRSRNFKETFVQFLIDDWTNDEFVNLCEGKIVKLNYDYCYVFEVVYNRMKRTKDYNSSC